MSIQMHPSLRVSAGVWLKQEMVDPHGLSVTATAEKLGVTRQAMSALLNGKAGLSADMAIRFEKAFGIQAETLMRMQAAYDLAQARLHEKDIKVTPIAA